MSTPQEFVFDHITTAKHFMLVTDQPILVSLDVTTTPWSVGVSDDEGAVLLVGSFTHVYVKNESTTNTATVDILVSD
jgi:hypothetical protein